MSTFPASARAVVIGCGIVGNSLVHHLTRLGWTDVVQMFVYIAGALVVFVALITRIPGGWAEAVAAGEAAGKFAILNLSTDPKAIYTLWAGVIGGIALTLATHGTDQFLVQRLLSARSARHSSASAPCPTAGRLSSGSR